MIGDFHFLRPWWLLALALIALIVWRLWRQRDAASRWGSIVAPHLLSHLIIQAPREKRGRPVLALAVVWMVTVIALAGPTWRREPTPFADDTAALVIVLEVTPTMRTADVQPDRLSRSIQKIHDLLAKRPGAKAALVVYGGSVHVVSPLTGDAGIINTFADALDPKIMPMDGDASERALREAKKMLTDARLSGSVLWITDGASSDAAKALSTAAGDLSGVRVLAPLPAGAELDAIDAVAHSIGADVTTVSPDDGDVAALARDTRFASVGGDAAGQQWHESGYAMVPVVVLLSTLWFRRGVIGACAGEGGRHAR